MSIVATEAQTAKGAAIEAVETAYREGSRAWETVTRLLVLANDVVDRSPRGAADILYEAEQAVEGIRALVARARVAGAEAGAWPENAKGGS